MKKLVLIIQSFLITGSVFSQQSDCISAADKDYEDRLKAGIIGREYLNPVDGFAGDQYFNVWALGEVTLTNGDIIRDIFVQYDKYLDELLWLREADFRKGLLNKHDIAGFRILGNRDVPAATFIKKRITVPWMGLSDAFVQVLVSGETSLYAYRNVTKVPNNYQLNDNTVYFLSVPEHDYQVRLRRKDVLSIPEIPKATMKMILRTNRITVNNNEPGLIRALTLLNASPAQ